MTLWRKKLKACFVSWICQEYGPFPEYKDYIYITRFKDSQFDSIDHTKRIGSLSQPLSNVLWNGSADFRGTMALAWALNNPPKLKESLPRKAGAWDL